MLVKGRLECDGWIVLEYAFATSNGHDFGAGADSHLNVGVTRIQGEEKQKSFAVYVKNINAILLTKK